MNFRVGEAFARLSANALMAYFLQITNEQARNFLQLKEIGSVILFVLRQIYIFTAQGI